jgi:general secretion pathway protein A
MSKGASVHYEDYWGLQAPPFENVPDPTYYFPSVKHEEALHRLLYGVEARKGAIMLTGEIGCGKTLLSRALILHLSKKKYDIALIADPSIGVTELLRELLYQLGIEGVGSKVDLLHRLNTRLLDNMKKGTDTVLIIDEAQAIRDDQIFEEIRLLLNFQLNDRFLLTLVLMGQPELRGRVGALRQLAQRIAIRYHLAPFSSDESDRYIHARVKRAGGSRELFTRYALLRIFQESGGIARNINTLCDLCLLAGYMEKAEKVDVAIVEQVAKDLA